MSPRARTDTLRAQLVRPSVAHAGLILDRYVAITIDGNEEEKKNQRQREIEAARRALTRCRAAYDEAFRRRQEWGRDPGAGRAACDFFLETPPGQRLVVGLGRESPHETGLALHHTYGTPFIPGSALKGIAEHYCRVIHDGAGHDILFGAPASAGYFVFHDAWIDPESLKGCLLLDVLTPHHPAYYGGRRYPDTDTPVPPTDFDDPVPVGFLSIRGTFHFLLSCDDASDHARQWLDAAKTLLAEALADWGAGGKTSSGYGRLVLPPDRGR